MNKITSFLERVIIVNNILKRKPYTAAYVFTNERTDAANSVSNQTRSTWQGVSTCLWSTRWRVRRKFKKGMG
jgi:hypothetical protein